MSDAYTIAPLAQAIYAADVDWWGVHYKTARDHGANLWTCAEKLEQFINVVRGRTDVVWSAVEPIGYGGNSGFQAIQLAQMFGFRRVLLLGFDMGFEPGTPKHFFGEHPRQIDRNSDYENWIQRAERAAPLMRKAGFEVINCSRRSALRGFARMDLATALRGCAYTGFRFPLGEWTSTQN